MSQERKVTYEPQFPYSGNTDMVRPFLEGPAVACHPDGTISSGQGLKMAVLGVDEMRLGFFRCPDAGDAFGGKRVLDSEGKLISWSLFLMPIVEDEARADFRAIVSKISDAEKRTEAQMTINSFLPHLVIDPEEGIYMDLKSGKRLELTRDGVVVHDKNSQEINRVEEGNFICVPASEVFPSIPLFSEGEVGVGLNCSSTPREIFEEIEALLSELGFNSSDERVSLELVIRDIISPVIKIYPE